MYADRLFNALERNEPGPGQLLVAAPGTLSPEFARSVILVIEHNDKDDLWRGPDQALGGGRL